MQTTNWTEFKAKLQGMRAKDLKGTPSILITADGEPVAILAIPPTPIAYADIKATLEDSESLVGIRSG